MIYLKGLLHKLEPYFNKYSQKAYLYISRGKPYVTEHLLENSFIRLVAASKGSNLYKMWAINVVSELGVSNDFLHRVIVGKWNILAFTKNTDGAKARRYFYYDQVMELSVFLEHYKLFRLVNDQVFQQAFPKYSHKSFKKFYDEFIDGKDIYSDRIQIFCRNVLENKYSKGSK